MIDGKIDYTSYTRQELLDVLVRIDRAHFPENYTNLIKELETRPTGGTEQESGAKSHELTYAGFWIRLGAYLLDLLILLPWFGVLYFLFGKTRMFELYMFVPDLLFSLWFGVYLVVAYGGTPGKMILGLSIAMTDGTPVTSRAAMLRYSVGFVFYVLSSFSLILAAWQMTDAEYFSYPPTTRLRQLRILASPWYYVLEGFQTIWALSEFVTMLFNKKRRAVHDYMAGTVVIVRRASNVSIERGAAQRQRAAPHA